MRKYDLTDNAYDIIEKNKANILELILNQSKGGGIPWLDDAGYADITAFGNDAKDYEVVKYNLNADGTNNKKGFVFLIKTPSGIIEFRTFEEIKEYVDGLIAAVDLNIANQIALVNGSIQSEVDSLNADIAQLASEIQVIENTWTGSENAHGIDLATLTGDKGAFDLTPSEKLFATFQIEGLKPEVKQEVEIIHGIHTIHLTSVDRTTDVSFQIQTAPIADGKHLLAISDFASHGTVVKTENDIKLVELMQNPKSTAVIDAYTKAEADDKFALKTKVIESVEPSMTVDGSGKFLLLNADTAVGNHTLATMVDGEQVDISFKNANSLGNVPADDIQVFIGTSLPIRILNSAGSSALKWGNKTNATDVNVKDNFQTHNFRVEKQGNQYNFIKLINVSTPVDKTYVDNAVGAKQDKLTPSQQANVDADHSAYLTSLPEVQLLDATSTADIAVVRNHNNMKIQLATYTTGVAMWLKDNRQGTDDTYVGINIINGVPKLSYKKHGEAAQKDIDLVKLVELAGKTITPMSLKAKDGTVFPVAVLEG